MSHPGRPRWHATSFGLLFAVLLSACGGGGGSDGPGFVGGGTDPGTDPTLPTDVNIDMVLRDPDGEETNNVTVVDAGVLTITVTNLEGSAIPGQIVSVTTTIGELDPDTGTALTDDAGEASILITAGASLGAGTVTATVTAGDVDFSEDLNFQVGEASLDLGRLDENGVFVPGEIQSGTTSLSAAGSTPLEVAVVDSDGDLVETAVAVSFSSGCAALDPPTAELTASATTINGLASATYTVGGCTGNDTVTASLSGTGNTQTATVALVISAADVNSINFTSAEPATLALKGTGGEGRSETSVVQFSVQDTTGAPVQGVEVAFSLSTTIGGLSLTNDTAITNDEGVARAIVQAGNVSTSVRVTATLTVDGLEFDTVSDKLVVTTGLPDQNSFSISVVSRNPGGADFDGTTNQISIRMADKFNNPVPDGTTALFTTELGSIVSTCETVDGGCSVTWESQNPRLPLFNQDLVSTIFNRTCPSTGGTDAPCPDDIGETNGLRSAILVTAIGEESFDDENGNGVWDIGEAHDDLPEAFLDHNENDEYDGDSNCTPSDTESGRECASGLEETFVDFNENGEYDDGNGIYNGTLCPQALADQGECSRDLVTVRADRHLVMSSFFEMYISLTDDSGNATDTIADVNASNESYTIWFSDRYNNVPDSGASISVSTSSCLIASLTGHDVVSTNRKNAYGLPLILEADPDNEDNNVGLITIEISTGQGVSFQRLYSCTDIGTPAVP
jgi:hypothetical protein